MKTLFPSCSWTCPHIAIAIQVNDSFVRILREHDLGRSHHGVTLADFCFTTMSREPGGDWEKPCNCNILRSKDPFVWGISPIQSYDLGMGFFDHQSYEFSGGVWILRIVDASEIRLTGCSLVAYPIIFTRDLLHLRWCRIFSGQRCVFLNFELWIVAVGSLMLARQENNNFTTYPMFTVRKPSLT